MSKRRADVLCIAVGRTAVSAWPLIVSALPDRLKSDTVTNKETSKTEAVNQSLEETDGKSRRNLRTMVASLVKHPAHRRSVPLHRARAAKALRLPRAHARRCAA